MQPQCLRCAGDEHLPFAGRNAVPARHALRADAGVRQRRRRRDCGTHWRHGGGILPDDDGARSRAWLPKHRLSDPARLALRRALHHRARFGADCPSGHDAAALPGNCLHAPRDDSVGGTAVQPRAEQQEQAAGHLRGRNGHQDGLYTQGGAVPGVRRGAERNAHHRGGAELPGLVRRGGAADGQGIPAIRIRDDAERGRIAADAACGAFGRRERPRGAGGGFARRRPAGGDSKHRD